MYVQFDVWGMGVGEACWYGYVWGECGECECVWVGECGYECGCECVGECGNSGWVLVWVSVICR